MPLRSLKKSKGASAKAAPAGTAKSDPKKASTAASTKNGKKAASTKDAKKAATAASAKNAKKAPAKSGKKAPSSSAKKSLMGRSKKTSLKAMKKELLAVEKDASAVDLLLAMSEDAEDSLSSPSFGDDAPSQSLQTMPSIEENLFADDVPFAPKQTKDLLKVSKSKKKFDVNEYKKKHTPKPAPKVKEPSKLSQARDAAKRASLRAKEKARNKLEYESIRLEQIAEKRAKSLAEEQKRTREVIDEEQKKSKATLEEIAARKVGRGDASVLSGDISVGMEEGEGWTEEQDETRIAAENAAASAKESAAAALTSSESSEDKAAAVEDLQEALLVVETAQVDLGVLPEETGVLQKGADFFGSLTGLAPPSALEVDEGQRDDEILELNATRESLEGEVTELKEMLAKLQGKLETGDEQPSVPTQLEVAQRTMSELSAAALAPFAGSAGHDVAAVEEERQEAEDSRSDMQMVGTVDRVVEEDRADAEDDAPRAPEAEERQVEEPQEEAPAVEKKVAEKVINEPKKTERYSKPAAAPKRSYNEKSAARSWLEWFANPEEGGCCSGSSQSSDSYDEIEEWNDRRRGVAQE